MIDNLNIAYPLCVFFLTNSIGFLDVVAHSEAFLLGMQAAPHPALSFVKT